LNYGGELLKANLICVVRGVILEFTRVQFLFILIYASDLDLEDINDLDLKK
jgi:hypothetical protein